MSDPELTEFGKLFGLVQVKTEGSTITYDPQSEYFHDPVNWTWLERRVPEECVNDLNKIINAYLQDNGYRTD